ncbi:formylglycine-generating enzyme family protein [Gracilimonas mengyeensis]|uniref:Formylglycine-generating enzyme, required for sulfatase activity, contains SUMF1/FGE domain n=1 Tax=Gracilimonas mengyeensis TaxID=1302730 RepID=A0A521BIN9_9BACT|nr:formylglycine-generating enzyme family protein [Gracilimonas mengyeensis]SMO46926.1 Formylglycine-generating enzyme, required for sulfatase activity, contains SUMF1/FGE domain [Gracilimonas mengyeensis]
MRSLYNISLYSMLLLGMIAVELSETVNAQQTPRKLVPAGSYHSVLPEVVGEPVQVDSFYMDETVVTNEQYVKFLEEHPEWRRSEIPPVFTNDGYLREWDSDLNPGYENLGMNRPVTRVSWFAANAYCAAQGGRLPTLNEWEYSAQLLEFANEAEANKFSSKLISWYSGIDVNNLPEVGSTQIETTAGVKDQFGLIMEWVDDFKPIIADELSLDCGTVGRMQTLGSVYSYAASIRYITRMSFNAKITTGMVGFRCAFDQPAPASQNTQVETL